ncbi:hypothetical protein SLW70_08640 [Flavobacterium sp. NG2]|uniref:hypothetical protein n=1 Tax=Flavobacterium sp. NG2 TaxID=3097547 RepID=UPI002A8111A0|nr:hypothetical protein [Flavobacterium sp. NG2]WPR73173.1 hypothetical protein SLW70_08640 [Flavobacterium sp. NG2]
MITVVALMLIAFSAKSQKKKGSINKDCFLQNAVSTFNLSEDSKSKLNELLKGKEEAITAIRTKAKANEISGDEVKSQMRAVNKGYLGEVATLVGKNKKEVMTFEKEVRKTCK